MALSFILAEARGVSAQSSCCLRSTLRSGGPYAAVAGLSNGAANLLSLIVNAMLPLEPVQHYLSLDSDALTAYDPGDTDGLTAAEIFKSRLKILKAQAETYSTDQLNDLFYELSDYIVTDMKSGAIMKIIDKADRYEIFSSIHVPGEYVMEDDAAVAFIPDEAALNEIVIDAFLEENPW